ncbi:MAG TPA: DUF2935 domain-containing protein [Clostridia bacterium]|nr:DUF2935 domain-containing protein [Clostridia bacterium]
MGLCYGELNHLRILEEAGFWKRQEAEHTVVIREIVPTLEAPYADRLQDLQLSFQEMENTVVQLIERLVRAHCPVSPALAGEIRRLIENTAQQSRVFVNFLNTLLQESAALQENPTAAVVINHIIRESEYYLGIAQAYLSDRPCSPVPPV